MLQLRCNGYSIIRLYRNSAYIEVQSAVPPDTMSIQKMIGYIQIWIYWSMHHGPLNFDITGLHCSISWPKHLGSELTPEYLKGTDAFHRTSCTCRFESPKQFQLTLSNLSIDNVGFVGIREFNRALNLNRRKSQLDVDLVATLEMNINVWQRGWARGRSRWFEQVSVKRRCMVSWNCRMMKDDEGWWMMMRKDDEWFLFLFILSNSSHSSVKMQGIKIHAGLQTMKYERI